MARRGSIGGKSPIFLLLISLIVIFSLFAFLLGIYCSSPRTLFQHTLLQVDLNSLKLMKASELREYILELKRIENSINEELLHLENKRHNLLDDIQSYSTHISKLQHEFVDMTKDLEKIRVSIEQAELQKKDVLESSLPVIQAPKRILSSDDDVLPDFHHPSSCSMNSCFDYSKCSLFSDFPVSGYGSKESVLFPKFIQSPYFSNGIEIACITVVFVDEKNQRNVTALPSWKGDGRNHVLLASFSKPSDYENNIFTRSLERAIIASSYFPKGQFRPNFDITLPFLPYRDLQFELLPFLYPLRRQYFLSFIGCFEGTVNDSFQYRLDRNIISVLNESAMNHKDNLNLHLQCCGVRNFSGWIHCSDDLLLKSTFGLIITSYGYSTTLDSQAKLFEILESGAIPVVLGDFEFGFGEVISWSKCAIQLPKARVTELHFYLRTLTDVVLFERKSHCRFILQQYLSSHSSFLETFLLLVRKRLGIPSKPLPEINITSFLPEDVKYYDFKRVQQGMETDETLGPLEAPLSSSGFNHNFSTEIPDFADPFHLYPSTPMDPILSTEAKFHRSGYGFRPINLGIGGSGREFSTALGGNTAREQFTIVILTYERELILLDTLKRFNDLPFLNKIIVVWNTEGPPSPDIQWPNIGVKIEVLRMERNSLNNRFLPFDLIKTDAVLSIDDDTHLRHDEIIFAFRVWREQRDRIVGFPARYHAWDSNSTSWRYSSEYTCEYSMILTGAAFLHKYFLFAYTYTMPDVIRTKVDEFMNCEDIAMNFLVSFITRKPPVKVTSRWTFRCPSCTHVLWSTDQHFEERHECINYFVQVYGYNPLLYSQFRADSVLFKTRLPPEKQKCFRLV